MNYCFIKLLSKSKAICYQTLLNERHIHLFCRLFYRLLALAVKVSLSLVNGSFGANGDNMELHEKKFEVVSYSLNHTTYNACSYIYLYMPVCPMSVQPLTPLLQQICALQCTKF